jgi:multicomponent Na+:H+ antiporter subunit F
LRLANLEYLKGANVMEENLAAAYDMLLLISVAVLGLLICTCLIRAVMGPRFTDRLVAINVICSKTVITIAVLAVQRDSSALLDVGIVYAMIGFLAVVVLSKCYVMRHKAIPLHEIMAQRSTLAPPDSLPSINPAHPAAQARHPRGRWQA